MGLAVRVLYPKVGCWLRTHKHLLRIVVLGHHWTQVRLAWKVPRYLKPVHKNTTYSFCRGNQAQLNVVVEAIPTTVVDALVPNASVLVLLAILILSPNAVDPIPATVSSILNATVETV